MAEAEDVDRAEHQFLRRAVDETQLNCKRTLTHPCGIIKQL